MAAAAPRCFMMGAREDGGGGAASRRSARGVSGAICPRAAPGGIMRGGALRPGGGGPMPRPLAMPTTGTAMATRPRTGRGGGPATGAPPFTGGTSAFPFPLPGGSPRLRAIAGGAVCLATPRVVKPRESEELRERHKRETEANQIDPRNGRIGRREDKGEKPAEHEDTVMRHGPLPLECRRRARGDRGARRRRRDGRRRGGRARARRA